MIGVEMQIEFVISPLAEKGKPKAVRVPLLADLFGFKSEKRRVRILCADEADIAVARDMLVELTEGA